MAQETWNRLVALPSGFSSRPTGTLNDTYQTNKGATGISIVQNLEEPSQRMLRLAIRRRIEISFAMPASAAAAKSGRSAFIDLNRSRVIR